MNEKKCPKCGGRLSKIKPGVRILFPSFREDGRVVWVGSESEENLVAMKSGVLMLKDARYCPHHVLNWDEGFVLPENTMLVRLLDCMFVGDWIEAMGMIVERVL